MPSAAFFGVIPYFRQLYQFSILFFGDKYNGVFCGNSEKNAQKKKAPEGAFFV